MLDSTTIPQDIDTLWDYDKPADSEVRFRAVLSALPADAPVQFRLEVLTQIARTQGLQRNFVEAHRTLDEVQDLLTGDLSRARVRYLLERGRVFNSSGHPDDSAPLFLKAWEIANEVGEEALAVDAAHMLGIVEHGEARMDWNRQALALAKSSTDPKARRWKASLYNNIGWVHHEHGAFEMALESFQKALEARQEQGDSELIGLAYWCVARTLRSLGRFTEALTIQEARLAALESQQRTSPYVDEEMGECLLGLGRSTEATPYFARAYAALSTDSWLIHNEGDRLARLALLAKNLS